jgi:hypothetical protein
MLRPKISNKSFSINIAKQLTVVFFPLLFTVSSFSKEPYFVKYPQINEKVADFATAFVQNILPEIKQSKIQFDFSNGSDGIKHTDMAYGQIQGTYTAVAQLPSSNDSAAIALDFRINLEVVPKSENKPAEFAINFRADGNIDNTKSFMNFFMGTLTPECIQDNHINDKGILGDICKGFIEKKIDSSKTDLENAFELLTAWKTKFLEGLNKIEHKEIKPIKAEFISYIDERIRITKQPEAVSISIELENLAKDFGNKARGFLQETKLIDYSINSLDIQMNKSEIQFSTHVVKLHVISSVNKYMELASSLTGIIESPENGASIGLAVRDGQGLSSGIGTWNKASAILAGGMIKMFGTDNKEPVAATKEEEDLGL